MVLGNLGIEETAMRNVLVVLVAVMALTLAGGLLAAPKKANSERQASAAGGLDTFSFIQHARDLPEQSFPAH
jgi:hypothetical protein